MSVSTLLHPTTRDEEWSSLYANSLDVVDLTLEHIHIHGNTPFIVDDLVVNGDLQVVSGQAIIGPNNFEVSNGAGTNEYVLSTNGAGITSWVPQAQNNGIIYRPGGISSGNVYATWAEIVQVVNNENGALLVYIDDSIVSPALITQNLDCHGKLVFRPYKVMALNAVKLAFQQDITLTNPTGFIGPIDVICNTNVGVNFIISNGNIINFLEGASLSNDPGSLAPAIQIADNEVAGFAMKLGGALSTNAAPVPLVNLGINSIFLIVELSMTQTNSIGNDIVTSVDASSVLLIQGDASINAGMTNAGFTGTTVFSLIDKAKGVEYDDSLVSPLLGVSNVQAAIDVLKTRTSQPFHYGGTTAAVACRFTANGTSVSAPPLADTYAVMNRLKSYFTGNIIAVVYDTTAGDSSSDCEVMVNNVAINPFTCTGGSGIASVNVPVSQGDFLQVRWTGSGVDPVECNFDLIFQYS